MSYIIYSVNVLQKTLCIMYTLQCTRVYIGNGIQI